MNKWQESLVQYFSEGIKEKRNSKLGVEVEHFLTAGTSGADLPYAGGGKLPGNDETLAGNALPYAGAGGVRSILSRLMNHYPDAKVIRDDDFFGFVTEMFSITLEPASQLEISIVPLESVSEIGSVYRGFRRTLKEVTAGMGVSAICQGTQPGSSVEELKLIPKRRYALMDEHFLKTGTGGGGRQMMRGTASQQVSVDYFSEEDFRKKMQAAYCFGPLLKLLEDNAPCFEGRKVSRRLLRTDIWRRVDPARCGIVPGVFSEMFGFADYASFIGAMPPIFIKKDGEILPTGFRTVAELYEGTAPERDEIEHLLSMAFPDVRLKQFLEIRFADSVPYPFMLAYCALIKGLIYSGEGTEWAGELIRSRNLTEASVTEAEYSLMEHGWDGSVYGFPAADMSRELIALAERNIPDEEKSLLDPLRDVIRYGGISRIPGEESGSLQ